MNLRCYTCMRFLLLLLLSGNFLYAQNLVVNPGFENCAIDSTSADQYLWHIIGDESLELEGWYMPSDGTSDHFYVGDSAQNSFFRGSIKPYEGYCYGGFISSPGYYEYISGHLSESMQRGETYTIAFALGTQANADFTEKRIGIHFASAGKTAEGNDLLKWKPHITLDTIQDRKIKGDWLIYTTTYTAKGGESVFTIGEFTDFYQYANASLREATYFYVDSFFIGHPEEKEIAQTSIAVAETVIVPADTNAIAPGKTLTLQNIYFETGKSQILPASYQPLYDIIVELKLQPDLKVEIVGHTDRHGNPADNQKLSEQRAQAVKDFFVSKGIDASRITTAGRGSSQPVGDDDQKNRRVEFRFYE